MWIHGCDRVSQVSEKNLHEDARTHVMKVINRLLNKIVQAKKDLETDLGKLKDELEVMCKVEEGLKRLEIDVVGKIAEIESKVGAL